MLIALVAIIEDTGFAPAYTQCTTSPLVLNSGGTQVHKATLEVTGVTPQLLPLRRGMGLQHTHKAQQARLG